MYISINSNHGIEVTCKFFKKFNDQLLPGRPTKFILSIFEIIMKENIYQFRDTYYLQLMGWAMGTSAAVNYSYIYIGLLEMTGVINNYKQYLLF